MEAIASQLEQEAYQHIGRALTSFGEIEEAVCAVYCTLLSANPIAGRHAYWAVHSFEARLKMVDALAQHVIPEHLNAKKFKNSWKIIKDLMQKCNRKRNELAHGSYVKFGWAVGESWKTDEFFTPFYHSENLKKNKFIKKEKNDKRPDKRIRNPDILKVYEMFEDAINKIYNFNIELNQNAEILKIRVWQF